MDYHDMKVRYTESISRLESQLTDLDNNWDDISDMISIGVDRTEKIRNDFDSEEFANIKKAFGSMYPEKTYFQNHRLRTGRRNNFIECIRLLIANYRQ